MFLSEKLLGNVCSYLIVLIRIERFKNIESLTGRQVLINDLRLVPACRVKSRASSRAIIYIYIYIYIYELNYHWNKYRLNNQHLVYYIHKHKTFFYLTFYT